MSSPLVRERSRVQFSPAAPPTLLNYIAELKRGELLFRAERGENTRTYAAENWQDDLSRFWFAYAGDIMQEFGPGGACMLYRYYDEGGSLLYAGISNEPGRRDQTHFGSEWYHLARYVHAECFHSRNLARIAEAYVIEHEDPEWNWKREIAGPANRYKPEIDAQGGRMQGEICQWFIIPNHYQPPVTTCRCFLVPQSPETHDKSREVETQTATADQWLTMEWKTK